MHGSGQEIYMLRRCRSRKSNPALPKDGAGENSALSGLHVALFKRRLRLKRRYLRKLIADIPLDHLTSLGLESKFDDLAVARNNSRMVIGVSATAEDGRYFVLKAGSDVMSRRVLAVETARLEELKSDLRGSPWLDYLPRRIVVRLDDPVPFVVDESLSSTTIQDLARRDGLDDVLVSNAISVIGELKREAATVVIAGPALIEGTIVRRVDLIRQQWGKAMLLKGTDSSLSILKDELVKSMEGRRVEVGWQHGDYSLGNVLVDSTLQRVTGIIDWGGSAPHELIGVDPALMALSAHGFHESGDVNSSVLRIVEVLARRLEASEEDHRLIERLKCAWPATQDLSLMQGVIITWIYHVAHLYDIRSPNVLAPGHWVQRRVSGVLETIMRAGVSNLHVDAPM